MLVGGGAGELGPGGGEGGGGSSHHQLAMRSAPSVAQIRESRPDIQPCTTDQTIAPPMSAAEFRGKCGVDVGTSAASRPGAAEIEAMVRRWSGLPAAQ